MTAKTKPKTTPTKPKFSKIFKPKLSNVGIVTGAFFFALSLFPSMLPRSVIMQSIVSAISLIIGYGIGVFGEWLWHYLQIPAPRNRIRKIVFGIIIGLVVFSVLSATVQSVSWQNDVRAIFGQTDIGISFILIVYVLAAFIALLLLIIGRSIRKLYQWITATINRFLPRRLSVILGVFLIFILLNFIYTGILTRTFFAVTNQMFSTSDVKINPKHKIPTSSLMSGSSASVVKWESLGKQGRKFVATTPTATDIRNVTGTDATDPIRVYVGLGSAKTVDQRADLVLEELIRTKAFERGSLMLATSTGTGWIDSKSVEPFEYMNDGNTAVIGVQYSYLPSWISLLADQQNVKDTSRVVFSKVYGYWSKLPTESRPKFYLYGLSLGSFGAETVLNSVELVNEPINGALLAGPPFVNEMHNDLEAKRDSGSPAWQPIINNGTTVRFTSSEDALSKPTGTWGNTKIVYLQHATDPIVWFSENLLFTEPDWLKKGQRGPGLTPDFVYVPVVTMWQMAADLPAAGSVKDGFGHNYSASSNVDAWSALTNPANWTAEKAKTLKEFFAKQKYEGA